MIAWTKAFPVREKIIGYIRLALARHRNFDHYSIIRKGYFRYGLKIVKGYQRRLASMRGCYCGRRCFVIGNGPSMKKMDLSPLKNEITIGCNGVYKAFQEWGFQTNFIFFEDIEQTELRRRDIPGIKGSKKFAALHNAYAFPADKETLFFYAPRMQDNGYYWNDIYPQFSKDFAAIAHLGSTVTYLMLQFAYHLGCDPVYIIGVDHDYGKLPEIFSPGKITITEDNIHLVRGLHFTDRYYKAGDQIGVPYVRKQEEAYLLARQCFEEDGRRIINAGVDSKLDIFEMCDFDSIFRKKYDNTEAKYKEPALV